MWAQEAGAIGGGCFKTQRQGSEIWNLGGEPRGFIGMTDARRATVRLDLRAYDAHHRVASRDTRPQSLSLPIENHGGRFAFQANPDSLPAWGRQVTKIFSILARLGPRSSAAGPTKGGSAKRSKIKGAGITGISIHGQAPVRSALNGILANGIPRPLRNNIQLMKKPSPSALPAKGPIHPPWWFYPNDLEARGLYPTGALARTLWRNDSDEIEKHPPGGSIRIT